MRLRLSVSTVTFLSFLLSQTVSGTTTTTIGAISPSLHWTGRHQVNLDNTVSFDWEGSSFSSNVAQATQVSMSFAVPTGGIMKFHVYINEADTGILYPNASTLNYQLVNGLNPASTYTIKVYNSVEPMRQRITSDDDDPTSNISSSSYTYLGGNNGVLYPTLLSLSTDGTFLATAPPQQGKKIIFFGDSITAGSGTGGTAPCAATIYTCDGSYSHANLIASNFSAELLGQIAWSGIGLYENCCNNKGPTLTTLGLQRFGNDNPLLRRVWDFNNPTRPDALVISLGTNDFSGPGNAKNATFIQAFTDAYVEFIYNLTHMHLSNGTSAIFLGIGPISYVYGPAVVAAMEKAKSLYSLPPMYIINFTDIPLNGCNGHPSRIGQEIMAAQAVKIISESVLQWKPVTSSSSSTPFRISLEEFVKKHPNFEGPKPLFPPTVLDQHPHHHSPVSSIATTVATTTTAQDYNFTVRTDGTGDFTSVQAALNYCNSSIMSNPNLGHVTLHVLGTFFERVVIVADFPAGVTFIGDGATPDDALIIYNSSSFSQPFGTWYSQTVLVQASNVTFINIAIANNASNYNSAIAGQSVALHIDATGDFFSCWNCALYGAQDTVYTGPSGYGLRNYFFATYSNGTTDSWFGGSSSVMEQNTIEMEYTVTAPRGDPTSAYLFLDCTLTTTSSVLFGRPWGQLSTVVFKNTYLGGGVEAIGWDDWQHGCTDHTSNWCASLFLAECNSTGPGAVNVTKRVSWSTELSPEEGQEWNRSSVLRGWEPLETALVTHEDSWQAALRVFGEARLMEIFSFDDMM